MAKEIYKSGNYIVTVDADDNSRLFPIGKTVYDEYNSVFRLTEGLIEDDQLIISYADSTNWVDDSAVAYTEATLRTFLRENTGFRPASGGSGAAPVGATIMKTGQTVSYNSKDDGDIEAGRATDFLTLASANPFGTNSRFTDELGTQTYTNKIVIDWSTYNGTDVLGYTDLSGIDTWSNVLSYCDSLTVGSYTSGWRLANIKELYNVSNFGVWPHTYTPFNIFNGGGWMSMMWVSTSYPYDPVSYAGAYNWNYFNLFWRSKTSSYYGMPVRTFTVSGTTLT